MAGVMGGRGLRLALLLLPTLRVLVLNAAFFLLPTVLVVGCGCCCFGMDAAATGLGGLAVAGGLLKLPNMSLRPDDGFICRDWIFRFSPRCIRSKKDSFFAVVFLGCCRAV